MCARPNAIPETAANESWKPGRQISDGLTKRRIYTDIPKTRSKEIEVFLRTQHPTEEAITADLKTEGDSPIVNAYIQMSASVEMMMIFLRDPMDKGQRVMGMPTRRSSMEEMSPICIPEIAKT